MSLRFACLLCLLLAALPSAAAFASSAADFAACRQAAARAEAEWQLPPGLLMAIGREESGRWDDASRAVSPWPFSANAAGASRFFETRAEAVAYVAEQQRSGLASIDVGCFQINLKQHPAAFATLEEAFDPESNARYAARFLSSLYTGTGNWPAAIGRYHSGTEALALPYSAAVLNLWNQPAPFARPIPRETERIVAGILVQYPGSCPPLRPRAGLPRVITPTYVLRPSPATYRPHPIDTCGARP